MQSGFTSSILKDRIKPKEPRIKDRIRVINFSKDLMMSRNDQDDELHFTTKKITDNRLNSY